MQILLRGVWSQLTPLPQHMQSRLHRCSVSHLKRTYRVFHELMFEEWQNTQRNEIARSLIASECSHSCHQTAQHLLCCATRLGTECIGKLQTHAQSRNRICRCNVSMFETNPKHTHVNKNEINLATDTHHSSQK